MPSVEDNKALVERFVEAFNKDAAGAVEQYLDESGTWWAPGSLPISGAHPKPVIVRMLEGLLEAFESPPALTIHAMTVEGDRVALEAESHGKLKDGRVYNNFYHLLFVTRDGKLHAVKEYCDTHLVHELFFAGTDQR